MTASAVAIRPSVATARVLADSQSENGNRLTTVEATFARSALAELNTHRAFSRNSASSRAIPVARMLDQVRNHPFIPRRFSRAQTGMHTSDFVEPSDADWDECLAWWLNARDSAADWAEDGLQLGLHKQDVNRLLEPFLMHTAIISSTEWHNFFDLRLATDADGNPLAYPPIFDLADAIRGALSASTPRIVHSRPPEQAWHLPLVGFAGDEELSRTALIKVSIARCARVSYLTHDGLRDVSADLQLYERLSTNGHLSPFEHVAHVDSWGSGSGNFSGWRQARWYIERSMPIS